MMLDKIKLLIAVAFLLTTIALYYVLADLSKAARIGAIVVGVFASTGLFFTTEMGRAVWSFIKGADIERRKVVWPGRQETTMVTLWVLVFVVILGLVMWLFDALSFHIIYDRILNIRY